MKKNRILTIVACLAMASLATSCSESNEDLIVGKWKCLRAQGPTTEITENPEMDYYNFKSGGTISMSDGNNVTTVAKYKVADDKLTVGEGKLAVKSKIEVLTSKAMIISRVMQTVVKDGVIRDTVRVEYQRR